MILAITERHRKTIALALLFIIYAETLLGAYSVVIHTPHTVSHWSGVHSDGKTGPAKTAWQRNVSKAHSKVIQDALPADEFVPQAQHGYGGPSQPEMQQFTSVNTSNMVDLFTGDFSYNIPLLDVGGYPVNIAYRSGASMDEEASWVGLGWNINPGTITRNMRGLPDDFNGGTDTIRKTTVTKENKTIGVTAGGGIELLGLPLNVSGSLGVLHNTYKGWGMETGLNVSINSGSKASGPLSGGLSITNSSQEGLTFSPNMAVKMGIFESENKTGYGTLSLGSSYNSRAGLSGLQLSGGVRLNARIEKNGVGGAINAGPSHTAVLSFGYPSFTPSVNLPYTGRQFSFSAKAGVEAWTSFPNFTVSGYVSKQRIDEKDRTLTLPAYGYLNYQNSAVDSRSLIDFNREKDIPFREKPAVPHIAIPSYTYDVFAMSGEGVGGTFRAYRGDIGYVHDHYMRTNDESDRFSLDAGIGAVFHGGADLNFNRSYTETGAWVNDNALAQTAAFRRPAGNFEAAYFRNPGEKTINSKAFYNAIGGDDVVVPQLYQPSQGSSYISGASGLNVYKNKRLTGTIALNAQNAVKPERDKRSQVISYLTAHEADKVGLSKYIESRPVNVFKTGGDCDFSFNDEYDYGTGTGLTGKYFRNRDLKGAPAGIRTDGNFHMLNHATTSPWNEVLQQNDNFSIQWTGRIKAPYTGTYFFRTHTDDGTRLWINDTLIIDDWKAHGAQYTDGIRTLNLVAGEVYNIRFEYFEAGGESVIALEWKYSSLNWHTIPSDVLYNAPLKDAFNIGGFLVKEKRINSYRKANHISEIDVLNADGRKYVYGIPVYNLGQKEVTFSVDKANGNINTGLTRYTPNWDNTVNNNRGRDNYFSAEEMPAYAHSYLLTGIVSPDYVDVTNNGISDDDLGDAIKFNYTKTAGVTNPYQWRAPYVQGKDSATYNEGLRTDSRDDKASYVSGNREVWYLHTIESKNMVAAFFLDNVNRLDGIDIDENGQKSYSNKIRRLRKIALYNKADFIQHDTAALPVKTVYFDYSYELCKGYNKPLNTEGKLTLKKIWFSYNGNEKGIKNPYVFTYHANNPDYNIKSYDRWGNYKSPADNPTTGGEISNADYPYVVQDSSKAASNVAAWALSRVKLPSGGVIEATYESDDYAYVQNRRSMQMCKLAGLSATTNVNDISNNLYGGAGDNLYAFIKVPVPVTSLSEVKSRYLDGIDKMYFRIYVSMPGDKWGNGYEYVPCYADLEEGQYGFANDMIWVKLKGIDGDGAQGGSYSPLAKTAIQFLRLNLPSKAYPGSDVGDNMDLGDGVRVLLSLADNILTTILSFDKSARLKNWAKKIDLNRSLARVTCASYKRLGGGSRVKKITTYDNWSVMTQQREATYGQEYTYTTTKEVNGKNVQISSGVAIYEPGIGGEENPFHLPIEYTEKASVVAPVAMGYTEEPLGESFYPGASVGYSKVRVRSIHHEKKRSANGFAESRFYTAYDFPTITDRSVIDDDTKKRYKPGLQNFLRINAKHYVTIAQGFKIELNDMHGKPRSQATYAENDPDNYITYSENFYKVENESAAQKQLSNTVMAMNPDGSIEKEAFIGKDAELLLDMREQQTIVNGLNVSINVDAIPFFIPPVLVIPTAYGMTQREETRFRSSAAVKVIQRFGILDSVLQIDKGSRVSVKNLLYDSETGDVLLTRTQNEFNDPIYNFTYPAHWAFDGMGMAYKNIDVTLNGLLIKNGRVTGGLPGGTSVNTYFTSGDELMASSKITIGNETGCKDIYATFPVFTKVWAVDANAVNGGAADLYFVDKTGNAFSGNDVSLKIIRSGRRNMAGPAGAVTFLKDPIVNTNGQYSLQLNTASQVVNASVAHYGQLWKVEDKKLQANVEQRICNTCAFAPFLQFLLSSYGLSTYIVDGSVGKKVSGLVQDAIYRGYNINVDSCPLLRRNMDNYFYAILPNYNIMYAGQPFIKFWLGADTIDVIANRNHSYYGEGAYLKVGSCNQNAGIISVNLMSSPDSTITYTNIVHMNMSESQRCGTYYSSYCYSNITDTVVNPYTTGLLGNFKTDTVYAYYGQRNNASVTPTLTTNIRTEGTFTDFLPFWQFNAGKLKANRDVSRWVWTGASTLFNAKGFELENRDPLNRYNAGLYGYNRSLPVAVVQNSQYREAGFDGFEDYFYVADSCSSLCPVGRHFDFSALKANMTTEEKHTGKRSLKVAAGASAGIAARISAATSLQPAITFAKATETCAGMYLKNIKTDSSALLPSFMLMGGKKIVVSAWVKEQRDCKCESYTGNSIVLTVTTAAGNVSHSLYPQGAIIEGWQRYESVISLPADASMLSMNFTASGNSNVYFDDVRVHPFNANMKSFVYHPVNLRLMAELDENNYATYYEYDDDGTLIRVKKETERGIKTIKETHSALRAEQ